MWGVRQLVKNRLQIVLAIALGVSLPRLGSSQITVAGTLIEERRAARRETYGGVLGLTNTSAQPQETRIYQTDYLTFTDGSSRYDEPGTTTRSNARWISIASRIVIPPGQSVDVPYNVAVPDNPTVAGTYWSVVMVEAIQPGSAESAQPGTKTTDFRVGIVPVFRTAVQIVTHVGPPTARSAKFETTKIQTVGDTATTLEFDLRNTGDLSFRPGITVELYSDDGTHVGTQKSDKGMTYPGLAVHQRFNLGRLRRGRYRAVVTADLGDGTVVGARYSFAL